MLTRAQRERCAWLAVALDAGDWEAWKTAAPSLSPEEKGEVWSQRGHVRAQAERSRPMAASARPAPFDLDDRPVAAEPLDDDDDDDMVTCAVCGGRGKDEAGNVCEACGGTGKVPASDDDEDEEARTYAIQDIEDDE
jgi:RecJ-like exonuclease